MGDDFRTVLKRAVGWRILVVLAAIYAGYFGILNNRHLTSYVLAVEIGSSRQDRIQFYLDDGIGYRETNSRTIEKSGRSNLEVRVLDLPAGNYRSLRIDPGELPGDVTIGRAWVMNRAGLTLQTLDLSVARPNALVTLDRLGTTIVARKAEPPFPLVKTSVAPPITDQPVAATEIAPQPAYDPQIDFPESSFVARTPIGMRLAVGLWHFAVALALLAGIRLIVMRAGVIGAWLTQNTRSAVAFAGASAVLFYLIGHMSFDLLAWEPFNEPFNKWGWFIAQGQIETPRGAFGAESILINGHEQVYFGVWPAVLRAALAPILGLEVNIGRRVFALFAVAILLLTLAFVDYFAARTSSLTARDKDRAGMIAVIAVAGATVLPIFLSRGYIYHEALGWSAVAVLAGYYCLLRLLQRPGLAWAGLLIACALIAAHSRPTGFFALAAACAFAGVWYTLRAGMAEALSFKDRGFNCLALAGLGFAGVAASFLLVGYLRFGALGANFPLDLHYGHPIERLAHFGGTAFHVDDIVDRIRRYFGVPGIAITGQFPYVNFQIDRNDRAVSDIIEPYIGAWALVGVIAMAAVAPLRRAVTALGGAGLAVLASGPLQMLPALMVVGVTFRYHVELLPVEIVAIAAFATVVGAVAWRRRAALALLGFAALVNALLVMRFQTEIVWGAPSGLTSQYASLRGLSVRQVYAPVLGDAFDFQKNAFENWQDFHRFTTLHDQTLASHDAVLVQGAAVVHDGTGIAMALPPGYCRAANSALLSVNDAMTMDLGWYAGPMVAAMPCDWAARFNEVETTPEPGEYPMAFAASPITQPRDAQRYFRRFADAIQTLCARGACVTAPEDRVLSRRWHSVVSATCADGRCTIVRRSQQNKLHGFVAVTLAVVRARPIFFYVYEPTPYFPAYDAGTDARVRARLETLVTASLAMNAEPAPP